jgi:phage terminase large subunit-like protein
MMLLGLRLGADPRGVVTTTPRPKQVVRELTKDETCVVTRGSTYDNAANLAPSFLSRIVSRYEGTSLGRQELFAELLDDMPGALWTRSLIDANRKSDVAGMNRIVVGVDPAISNTGDSDYTGIVVCGIGQDGHGYVLEDRSIRGTPEQWASRAVAAFRDWRADRIVAEKNQGGDMVESTIRHVDPNVAYIGVHASKGKIPRAEPISALYEQGRCHHAGLFPELEEQMCNYVPGIEASPDRMDAMVWAMTELFDFGTILAAPVGMGDGSRYANLR